MNCLPASGFREFQPVKTPAVKRSTASRSTTLHVLLTLLICLVGEVTWAVDELGLDIGNLSGPGWALEGLALGWSLADQRLILSADALVLPEPLGPVTGLQLSCARLQIHSDGITCSGGRMEADHPLLVDAIETFSFRFERSLGAFRIKDMVVDLETGLVRLEAAGTERSWAIDAEFEGLDLSWIQARLRLLNTDIDELTVRGRINGTMRVERHAEGAMTIGARIRGRALNFSDANGRLEGENIDLSLTTQASLHQGSVDFSSNGQWRTGLVFADPMLIEAVSGAPIEFRLIARATPEALAIKHFYLDHSGVGTVVAAATAAAGDWRRATAQIDLEVLDSGKAYVTYVQPFAPGTLLGDLQTGGRATAHIELVHGDPVNLRLRSEGAWIRDTLQRISFEDLSIDLDWRRDSIGRSRFGWAGSQFYKVPTGHAGFEFETRGGAMELTEPLSVPLLGGFLHLDRLGAENFRSPQAAWNLDGRLSGVSLEQLSEALEWPVLRGDLSGMVPKAVYRDRILTLGGALLIRAFDGDVTITDLRVEQPLGLIPRLTADIGINGLDLAALTQTYAFGRIEGRLDGRIRALELQNWRPVQFDAFLGTPEGDRSKRRISQRAVENLSSIGGGGNAAAILSKGFIGMFKDFGYRRLGIGCHLANNVCEMEGVSAAARGYYLVEGGGLPRIDVIGYERRVDWNELVTRLQAATRSSGPVVE